MQAYKQSNKRTKLTNKINNVNIKVNDKKKEKERKRLTRSSSSLILPSTINEKVKKRECPG